MQSPITKRNWLGVQRSAYVSSTNLLVVIRHQSMRRKVFLLISHKTWPAGEFVSHASDRCMSTTAILLDGVEYTAPCGRH